MNKKTNTTKKLANAAVGTGIVFTAEELTAGVMNGMNKAVGSTVPFLSEETIVTDIAEAGLGAAKSAASIILPAMIVYFGFEKMFSGFNSED